MKNYLLITILFIFALVACADNEPLSIATTNKAGSAGSAGKVAYKGGQSGSAGMNIKPMPVPVPVDILVPGAFDQKRSQDSPMRYEGGPVMTHDVNTYIIWYGNWQPNQISIIEYMISNFDKTNWYKINRSYYQELIVSDMNVGSPNFPIKLKGYKQHVSLKINFMMSINDDYSKGKEIDDDDIEKIISSYIKEDKLPLDVSGIYLFLTSKDVDHLAYFGGFCSDFCGWHNYFPISNANIKYAFIGDVEKCPKECSVKKEYINRNMLSPNGDWSVDGMASIIAHELVEVVTDPLPLFDRAWGDSAGYENADKCSWTYGQLYKTDNGSAANVKIGDRDFLIQQNWVLDDSIGNGHCGLSR